MKLLLFLALAAVTKSKVLNNKNCWEEVIATRLNDPYQLSIDYSRDRLFFSFTSPGDASYYASAFIDLKTNEYRTIPGIAGGFASAVDQKNKIVYLGGSDGVSIFDNSGNVAKHVGRERGHTIWQMYYKDRLYYTTLHPNERLFTYSQGESKPVDRFKKVNVRLMAVDNEGTIFISNEKGLFSYPRDEGDAFRYDRDYDGINAFAADSKGDVYFSTPDGIFYVDRKNKGTKKILDLQNVFGFAINADGTVIYANGDSIIKIMSYENKCKVHNLI